MRLVNFRRFALALFGILLILSADISAVHSQSSVKVDVNPRIGAVESYYRPEDAVEAGVGWDRIIFEWRYLQPNSARDWKPEQWQPYLDAAKQGNRKVVGLLKNAPQWASGSKVLGAVPSGLDLPLDDPKNHWAQFIRKLTTYYSQQGIHDWIIYNEPDIRPKDLPDNFYEFEGDVNAYYKLVKVAYQVAHEVDPKAQIHLAGMNYWIDRGRRRPYYMRSLIPRFFGDDYCREHDLCFDVLTVHIYGGTSYITDVVSLYRRILREYGFEDKRFWINEMNMRPTIDPGWIYRGKVYKTEPDVTTQDQAAYIIQAISLAFSLDVESVAIYRFYDNHYPYDVEVASNYEAWGVIRPNGTRRPGYYALQLAARLFRDIDGVELTSQRGITVITMTSGDQTIYVIWNDSATSRRVAVPVTGDKSNVVYTSAGKIINVEAQTTVIGDVFEFDLPPCHDACLVKGDPRIIVQKGAPQKVYRSSAGFLAKIG
ncbi:MAG: hypothetical protein U0528_15845 [Anaerolineae bacterium]